MDANERKALKLTIAGNIFVAVMMVMSSIAEHKWWRAGTLIWLASLVPVSILWLRRWRRQQPNR
jgi:uncharacterized protein (DUF983 family)